MQKDLPPGQIETHRFRRFGLPWLALRYPHETKRIEVDITGDVAAPCRLDTQWASLPRSEQTSDFHCVTTWSVRGLRWSGVLFQDFYRELIQKQAHAETDVNLVIFVGQDGYRNALPLDLLLADDVMLADKLDGKPLSVEHGAPLRLVAPAHYGYKSVKHLCRIEFRRDSPKHHRIPGPGFMSHRLGRVDRQERGRGLPGWCYRAMYRPLIAITAWAFQFGSRYHARRHR